MLYPHQASRAFAMIGDGPSTGDVGGGGKRGCKPGEWNEYQGSKNRQSRLKAALTLACRAYVPIAAPVAQ